MPQKIVDLSVAIKNDIPSDPPPLLPKIEYQAHEAGAVEFEQIFGIPVDKQLEGQGAAAERCHITTHAGTHVDAPWHYHATMNGGEPSWTIDEIPLDWFIGPGVKLDFRDKPDGHVCSADEIAEELLRINHELQFGDIVLVNTAAGARYGEADFLDSGCGMGREATLYLIEQGVHVMGTDAWGWDAPMSHTLERIKRTGDYSLFWEGHKVGAERAYCQIEKLGNLDTLPPTGYTVSCLPVKVAGASAGWCRAVALFGEKA